MTRLTAAPRALLLFVLLAPLTYGQAPVLTVEIVNDSDKLDSEIYVMMTGSTITPVGGGPLSNLDIPAVDLAASPAPTNTVVSVLLNTLPVSTNNPVMTSTLTGRTNTVYNFSLETVTSARLFVSHSPQLQFVGTTAPTNIEGYRFDKCEFDFSSPPTWAANLTSVDFLGVPMRLEAVDTTTKQTFDARSFYISQDTTAKRLAHQIALNNGTIGKVIQRDASNNFLRILSPATITTAVNTDGSADPYPSFKAYLKSLSDSKYTFTTSGTSGFGAIAPSYLNDQTNSVTVNIPTYIVSYNYTGVVQETSQGFQISMTGSVGGWSTNNASSQRVPIPVPSMFTTLSTNITYTPVYTWTTNITVTPTKSGPVVTATPVLTTTYTSTTNILTNTIGKNITMLLPHSSLDENIYGCPLTADSFQVTNPSVAFPTNNCNTGFARTNYFNAVLGNTVYSYVVANIQSGLNFGFLKGNYGNSTSNWFGNILPPTIPFGAGRPSNDGYYNAYTALLYNGSDSYGFAFNDRSLNGTNPLMSYSSQDSRMRVVILPDDQLDAPEVTVSGANGSGVTLSWPAVTNAPPGWSISYIIDSYPPLTNGTQTVVGTSQPVSLTPGVPYTFSVTARALAPGGAFTNTSYSIPVQGTTLTSFTPPSGIYTNQFNPSGWSVGVFSDASLYPITIGGLSAPWIAGITNYGNALLTGNNGTNYYPIVVKDSGGNVVYQNSIEVVFGASTNSGFYYVTEVPDLPGNSLPLTVAPPNPAVSPQTFPQGPWSNANTFYPTLSIPGQPSSFKSFAPAIFPPAQSSQQYWEQKSLEKYFYTNPLK